MEVRAAAQGTGCRRHAGGVALRRGGGPRVAAAAAGAGSGPGVAPAELSRADRAGDRALRHRRVWALRGLRGGSGSFGVAAAAVAVDVLQAYASMGVVSGSRDRPRAEGPSVGYTLQTSREVHAGEGTP